MRLLSINSLERMEDLSILSNWNDSSLGIVYGSTTRNVVMWEWAVSKLLYILHMSSRKNMRTCVWRNMRMMRM